MWIQLDISGQKSDLFPHFLRLFAHLMSIHIDLTLCRLMIVEIQRSVVVFPAPLGPRRP